MRYTRVGRASYLLAMLLVGAAVAFAASRMRGGTEEPPPDEASFQWQELGEATYDAECASCHPAGQGRRGAPPVQGLAVELFVSPGGRDYLVHLLLKGEVRTVEDGVTSLEPGHPAYDQLSDAEAAALLNHMLTAWGNEQLLPEGVRVYEPEEVGAQRR